MNLSTNKYKLPELHIGNKTARIPIIQGGMGVGVSLSGLAGAVAKEGESELFQLPRLVMMMMHLNMIRPAAI